MSGLIRLFLIAILLYTAGFAFADDEPVQFTDKAQEQRYYQLIEEIRCLVCQNQSLADSNADLAQDLRNEVYQMLVSGKQNEEIHQFLVERYGDFVLYRPPLKQNTWLLWFGPFVLLIIAISIAIILIKRQSRHIESNTNISEEDKQRLSTLINDDTDKEQQ